MKENIYDNPEFFAKYRSFPRSVEGLSAAGEWHELRRMLPDFAGRRVVDIGCGFGWHCVHAAERGAVRVVGVDISENMLAVARAKTDFPNVEYRLGAMEDLDFAPGSFDVAMSSLALHYTPDYAAVCRKVFDCLAPGGDFVLSVEHPVFTAEGSQDWTRDGLGNAVHWPVDGYFREGLREAVFLGEKVVKYHRTVTTYVETLLGTGFRLTGLVEPRPDPRLLETVPGMTDELRRPMMLILAARKAL